MTNFDSTPYSHYLSTDKVVDTGPNISCAIIDPALHAGSGVVVAWLCIVRVAMYRLGWLCIVWGGYVLLGVAMYLGWLRIVFWWLCIVRGGYVLLGVAIYLGWLCIVFWWLCIVRGGYVLLG